MSKWLMLYQTKPAPYSGSKPFHGKIIITEAINEKEALKLARKLLKRRFRNDNLIIGYGVEQK